MEQQEQCYNLKYLDVVKMKCIQKNLKVSKKLLDTVVEVTKDYVTILNQELEKIDESKVYKIAVIKHKIKEIEGISEYIANEIGYCKECKAVKELDDVGMDAFSILSRRDRPKKDDALKEQEDNNKVVVLEKKSNTKKTKDTKKKDVDKKMINKYSEEFLMTVGNSLARAWGNNSSCESIEYSEEKKEFIFYCNEKEKKFTTTLNEGAVKKMYANFTKKNNKDGAK